MQIVLLQPDEQSKTIFNFKASLKRQVAVRVAIKKFLNAVNNYKEKFRSILNDRDLSSWQVSFD